MEPAEVISEHRVGAVRLLAAAFKASGTRWAALHGAEAYPERVGRDLDVLVNPEDLEPATGVARNALEQGGWHVVVIRMPWNVNQVIGFQTGGAAGVIAFEVDFLCYQIWRGVGLVCGLAAPADCNVRPEGLPTCGWAGFVKRILIQCLAGNWGKMETRRSEWDLSPAELRTVPIELERRVGRKEGILFLDALANKDSTALAVASRRIGRRLQIRGFASPGFWFRTLPRWIADKAADLASLRPRAPRLDIAFTSSMGEDRRRVFIDGCVTDFRKRLVFASVSSVPAESSSLKQWKQEILRCRDAAMMFLVIHWGNSPCGSLGRGLLSVEVGASDGGFKVRDLDGGSNYSCQSMGQATDLLAEWICRSLAGMHGNPSGLEHRTVLSDAPISKE